jgi:type II secretory pathway predicted ATPase ExeA
MYRSYYKLNSKPFEQNPESGFLWFGERQEEILAALRQGLDEQKGIQLLSGDCGIGKTTLVEKFMAALDDSVLRARIVVLGDDRIELYNAIAKGLGLEKQFTSKVEFLVEFSHFLRKSNDAGKKILLIVDDAQGLGQELLEELRLLSNIEQDGSRLVCTLLVGNSEFVDRLAEPVNNILRKRIGTTAVIQPQGFRWTEEYIRHRLQVAGADEALFTGAAVQLIHSHSSGLFALVNEICECCLKAGCLKESSRIDADFVRACIDQDIAGAGDVPFSESVEKNKTLSRGKGRAQKWLLLGGICLGGGALAFGISSYLLQDKKITDQDVKVPRVEIRSPQEEVRELPESIGVVVVDEDAEPGVLPVEIKEERNETVEVIAVAVVEQPEAEVQKKESIIVIRELVIQ